MIRSRRLFERAAPTRDAKVFYIFCEGKCREYEYFSYFIGISSKIKIEVIPPGDGAPTPDKLYKIACEKLVKTDENPNPEYQLVSDIDEVWFVIDTDDWGTKIDYLRDHCQVNKWNVAQSNPCFEVWLYYHIHTDKPNFEGMNVSRKWKSFVNNSVAGGFDSRKHPVYIGNAIANAKNIHSSTENKIDIACSEVFILAENFYPFVQPVISKILEQIK